MDLMTAERQGRRGAAWLVRLLFEHRQRSLHEARQFQEAARVAALQAEGMGSVRRRGWRRAAEDRSNALLLAGAAMRLVKDIDYALARVRAGVHGTCEYCGGAVDETRLRALPYTTACAACSAPGDH